MQPARVIGLVIDTDCYFVKYQPNGCKYRLRLQGASMFTDTHVLSSDGPVQFSPIVTEWVSEIGVEKYNPPNQ